MAAIYSAPGDLYEATQPPATESAPGPWTEPPAEPAPTADGAAPDPAPVRIRPRRLRQTLIAAVATGVLGVAAIAALWLSIGRSLGPVTTVSIPLPSASEDALPTEPSAAPARSEASAPVVVAAAPQAAPETSPTPGEAAPTSSAPPAPANSESLSVPVERSVAASDDLDAVADDLLKNRIPAAALSAERRLARVLAVAAGASEFRRRGDVRTAMQAMRSASPKALFTTPVRGEEARTLNEAALVAYWRREDVDDAVRLQRKAFAANPLDSEVVGNLAFLQLKEQPPQAEAARQLALHALALNDPRFPSGRIEDWTAFAVASALTGHEADARNAWFASMALASDLQHQCNNAVRAEAIYGERLRPSVQAMLQRARSSAAYGRCEAALSPPPARARRPAAAPPKAPSKTPAKPAAKPAQRSHRPRP
jgi:plasmid stabilization system protein ParE